MPRLPCRRRDTRKGVYPQIHISASYVTRNAWSALTFPFDLHSYTDEWNADNIQPYATLFPQSVNNLPRQYCARAHFVASTTLRKYLYLIGNKLPATTVPRHLFKTPQKNIRASNTTPYMYYHVCVIRANMPLRGCLDIH